MDKALNSNHYQALRRILIAARERAGLSRAEVATKIGKTESYVSDFETGERGLDIDMYLRLTKALNLDAAEVMSDLDRVQD